jgi:hypothetical protein
MRHVIKHVVPKSIRGSPGWHREQYGKLITYIDKVSQPSPPRDLQAPVFPTSRVLTTSHVLYLPHPALILSEFPAPVSPTRSTDVALIGICFLLQFGQPDFFLTYCAGERGAQPWREITDNEDFMMKWGATNSAWNQAPTICARLYHHRLWKHLDHHVLVDQLGEIPGGIYGRIDHYIVRYEYQYRGSLHAHIILWVNKEDVQGVSDDIVAGVPLVRVGGDLVPPPAGEEYSVHREYYRLVMKEQQHVCYETGCLKHGPCKYNYPFQPHIGPTTFNQDLNQFLYYRPRQGDQFTIPHTAAGLVLWGAHMCILKVSAGNLGRYLLKYCLKVRIYRPQFPAIPTPFPT